MRTVWRRECLTWPSSVPRRAITTRRFRLPSWWLTLAPGQPASFWVRVERARQEAGVSRSDRDAIAYIVNRTPRRHRGRRGAT